MRTGRGHFHTMVKTRLRFVSKQILAVSVDCVVLSSAELAFAEVDKRS